ASGTHLFEQGVTSRTFTVTPIDNNTFEGDQTVNLTLSNPSGASIGNVGTALLTIHDDESQFSFQSATFRASELTPTATITVIREGGTTGSATVQFATSNGSATAVADYTANSGTLTFGP